MASAVRQLATQVLAHYGLAKDDSQPPPTKVEQLLQHPIFQQWAQYVSPTGLPPRKDLIQLIESYKGWVYSCVRLISTRVASLPLSLVLNEQQAQASDLTRTVLYAHPFLDMMWRPNPLTTRMELWITTLNHLELCGNAYWLVLKDRLGIFREIWPLYPQYMRIRPDQRLGVKGYVYLVSQPPIRFEVETADYKVVHFKHPNPVNPYYGVGPLEAQAMSYDLDLYMELYQRNFFHEGARPDFVLESDARITKDDADMVWELWDERHKGITKSWRPGILGLGLKAKPLNVSNRDLAFAALAGLSKDKILSAYGVPAAKLGLVQDFNRANADAADVTFNREAISPRCMLIEERIETEVLIIYPGQDDSAWLEVDFKNPVPEDIEMKLKTREANLRNYVTVVNEEREADGMEPVAWGNMPFVSTTVVQLGTAPPAPPTPPPPGAPPGPGPTPGPDADVTSVKPAGGGGGGAITEAEARERAREERWRAWVAKTAPEEDRWAAGLVPLWETLEREVLHKLGQHYGKAEMYYHGWSPRKVRSHVSTERAGPVDNWLFVLNEATQLLLPLFNDQTQAVVNRAGHDAVAEVGVGVWNLDDPLLQEWIKDHSGTAIKDILQTTLQQLRATLGDGLAAGEGQGELEKRVSHVFGIAKGPRTQAIVRTEVHTGANHGLLEGWRQSGAVRGKGWLTAHDERVRESHKAMDGVETLLHEDFHMKPPGSGTGPAPGHIGVAAEDINCRCTMVAVLGTPSGPVTGPTPVPPTSTGKPIKTAAQMNAFLKAKSAALLERFGDAYDVEAGAIQEYLESLRGGAHPLEVRKRVEGVVRMGDQLDSKRTRLVNNAIDRYAEISSPKLWNQVPLQCPIQPVPPGHGNRAFYHGAKNVAYATPELSPDKTAPGYALNATMKDWQETLLHEIGHHIEDTTPSVANAAELFYESRTKGEPLVKLRDVTNISFEANEVTRVDKWPDAYMGKWYGQGMGTEITSMGLQMMKNPWEARALYRKDRDYFAYIAHVLSGEPFELPA